MTDQGSFQLSQGFEVLQPRSGQAYPIPCDEWANVKHKISRMTSEPWLFHTLGSLLVGAAITTILQILFGRWSSPEQQNTLVIAWAAFATTAIAGLLSLYFAHKERAAHRVNAQDVITQMDFIERRYERSSPTATS